MKNGPDYCSFRASSQVYHGYWLTWVGWHSKFGSNSVHGHRQSPTEQQQKVYRFHPLSLQRAVCILHVISHLIPSLLIFCHASRPFLYTFGCILYLTNYHISLITSYGTINIRPYLPTGKIRGQVQSTSAKSGVHSSRARAPSKCTQLDVFAQHKY